MLQIKEQIPVLLRNVCAGWMIPLFIIVVVGHDSGPLNGTVLVLDMHGRGNMNEMGRGVTMNIDHLVCFMRIGIRAGQ